MKHQHWQVNLAHNCQKQSFTVMLCEHASEQKVYAFCVLKKSSGRIPNKVFFKIVIPENIRVMVTKNGWMHVEMIKEWVWKIWGPEDISRLLILDLIPIHKSPKTAFVLKDVNTNLISIPLGCTHLLQPADVSLYKPFKAKLQENWANYLDKEEKMKNGNLKQPSRQDDGFLMHGHQFQKK